MSGLARQKINENVLDQVDALARRIRKLETVTLDVAPSGHVTVAGLKLPILVDAPAPPETGLLIYAIEDGGTVYIRAVDSAGVEEDVATWV